MAKITIEIRPLINGFEVLVHDGHMYGNEPIGSAATREMAEEIRNAYIKGWNDRAWWGEKSTIAEG